LTRVAAAASGATGADVERWVRFARRKARNAERPLTIKDLLTTISAEFSSLSQRERHVIAVHEAGHALAAILERIEIRHVSILSPDGGGATSVSRWSKFATRGEYRRHLRFILAGRAAEELTFGEPSDGAGGSSPDSDIARATSIAIAMESDLGLSEDHGLIWLGSAKNPDGPWSLLREPKFADKISTLLKGLYVEVIANLQNHRRILDEIAQSLLEKGHLGGEELVGLVRARLSSVAGKR
jgi:ATP-dependent Zn protease